MTKDMPKWHAVSAVAALLFGTDSHDVWIRGRWWPRYIAVAILLALIVLARRPDVVSHPQFWAEDGFIFFRDDVLLGFPRAAFQLYQGFPQLGQRLIAAVAGLFPISAAPRIYTTAAIVVAALAIATFSLPRFRHVVESDALRAAFCVACVCVPAGQEVFATPTNVGWFLGLWLLFASLSTAPRQPWSLAGLVTCAVVAVYSTPLAALIAPLWLLRTVDGAVRGDRREVAFGGALLVAVGLLFLVTRKLGGFEPATLNVPGHDPIVLAFRWSNLASAIASTLMGTVLPQETLGWLATSNRPALQIAAAVLVGVLVGVAGAQGRRRLAMSLLCLFMIVGALASVLIARPLWNLLLARETMWQLSERYTVFPFWCSTLAIVTVLDGIRARRRRTFAAGIACAVVAVAWSPSFAIAPLPDLHWAEWAARLQTKLESGSQEPLVIPMNPAGLPVFTIRFDAVSRPGKSM